MIVPIITAAVFALLLLWSIDSRLGDIRAELRKLNDQEWKTTDELKKIKQVVK